MKIITKLTQALDTYDPYGFMRVSSIQSVILVICLFIINFAYNLPNFNVIMQLPLFGLMAIGGSIGYNRRIKNMTIFVILCIIYTIMLSVVQNYRILVVLTVGVVILSLFTLSKKYYTPILLMVAPIQAVSYTALVIPFGGNWYQLLDKVFSLVVVGFLGIGLLYLFPRIYFFAYGYVQPI